MNHSVENPSGAQDYAEVESKVLDVNPADLIPRILAIGATVAKDRRLLEATFLVREADDKSVRIRTDGGEHELCHKGEIDSSIPGVKKAQEYETLVSDPVATEALFGALGFKRVRFVTKMRTSFVLDPKTKIEIDEYPGIPPLMEIEAMDYPRIVEVAAMLGFSESQLSSYTIRDLERHYGVRFGQAG